MIKFLLKCSCILVVIFDTSGAVELPIEILSGLGSQQFREREVAQVGLIDWARAQPAPAMEELLRRSRIADDPEVRERCLSALRALVTDEYLREGEGYLGIMLKDETSDIPGESEPQEIIRVLMVKVDSPADHGGIRLNDMIVRVNGDIWQEFIFRANIRKMKPGLTVDLKIFRDGGWVDLKVPLGRRPLNADNWIFPGQTFDPEAAERAAEEAYFRRWLSLRKLPK